MNLNKAEKEILKKLSVSLLPLAALDFHQYYPHLRLGQTFAAIHLLERIGYISGEWVEGSDLAPERRVYSLTGEGRDLLKVIDQQPDRTFLDELGYLLNRILKR